jgi:hypothetical protein
LDGRCGLDEEIRGVQVNSGRHDLVDAVEHVVAQARSLGRGVFEDLDHLVIEQLGNV